MSYVALANDIDGGLDPSTCVKLWVSPDMVVGLDNGNPGVDTGWDWIADGYCVMRTGSGSHDGHPATVMTLADSDTQREVGRLVLRNDALRDARLEVTRQFESTEARDAFVAQLMEMPGTDEIKSIQLDVVAEGKIYGPDGARDETLLDVLLDMTEGTTISYRVVTLNGPGGGNPVIEFTGKDRELRAMLRDKYCAGEQSESVAFYMGEED